jgi:nucleoid DNA-binding protein
MSVPVDFTINKIIDNIYAKLDGKIDKEVIQNVINFQSFTVRQGIEDGDNIHLRYIGSFKFNHKRAFKMQEAGKDASMKVEQEIVKKEGSKSWKVKETRRIVFKRI